MTPAPSTAERYRGALLGLAVGDALGAPVESRPPGTFAPVSDMLGGGPFGLGPGQWTDDTSMALCLAESLIEKRGFDLTDQLERYLRWWREGHLSSTGVCFGMGMTTQAALQRFQATRDPHSGSSDPQTASNGAIMRLAPVLLAFASDPKKAIALSGESARTTHGARSCIDGCRYLGALIVGALRGEEKGELLSPRYSPLPSYWDEHPLGPEIDEVARGSFKRRQPPAIQGSGYVVKSLEAALWAFYHSDSFEEGALKAVNLGDDADTTGAVYGQLAGAYYGERAIPQRWRDKLASRELIERLAEGLLELARA
jgi:ADP-ribosyl-[dinitrogen reductase] hydrolase